MSGTTATAELAVKHQEPAVERQELTAVNLSLDRMAHGCPHVSHVSAPITARLEPADDEEQSNNNR